MIPHRRSNTSWLMPAFWVFVIVVPVCLRTATIGVPVLIPEEAYYWNYAQHPALSYFDHPPMVAWIIRGGTSLFGDTEFGVRIPGVLLSLLASGMLYAAARIWFDRISALLAAAMVQVLPLYFAVGFVATMDAPLMCFWAVCLLGVGMALRHHRPAGWYIAGVALGAAMLSKYTAVFLAVGGFIAVVGRREWRPHLKSVHPYAASILGAAVFSPVIIWNGRHDWASMRFQLHDRFDDGAFHLMQPTTFVGIQIATLTPILVVGLVLLISRLGRRPVRTLRARTWFALAFSVPLLALMMWKSLRYTIHVNWLLPAWLSMLPLIVHELRVRFRARRLRSPAARMPGLRWTFLLAAVFNIIAMVVLWSRIPRLVAPEVFGPWNEITTIVREYERRLANETGRTPRIIADGRYRLASVISFYWPHSDERVTNRTTSQWIIEGEGLAWPYWTDPEAWRGTDCIFVDYDEHVPDGLQRAFGSVEIINDPRLSAFEHHLLICRDFRTPPDPNE